MTRALLATASAAALLVLAGPAAAGGVDSGAGPGLEDDEKHICVITNSTTREGYCVYTYGVHLPELP